MKSPKLMCITAIALFAVLAIPLCLAAQANQAQKTKQNGAADLSSLPMASQSAISAAMGREIRSYRIEGKAGNFHAKNASHNLAVDFSSQGVALSSGNSRWRLAFQGYGYGSAIGTASPTAPRAKLNRVEYRRGLLTEWYMNGPVGLEQGFTLNAPPGQANGQPVTLALTVSGNGRADIEKGGTSLTLSERDGQVRLRYVGLTAHDATGRELRAWLDLQGDQLLLKVVDTTARYPVVIDPFVQLAKLTASGGDFNDLLGVQVSISGNTIVALAPDFQFRSPPLDWIYVFVKPASGWRNMTQTTSLGGDGRFTSVSISGNTIVAGAPGTTVGGHIYQGAAYVFVNRGGVWSQAAELTASDGQQYDDLGVSVAISGNTVVAATPQYSSYNPGPGAAYVFVKPASGWANMTQTAKLTASDGKVGDDFGSSASISGSTAVAGAAYAGAAYVFVRPASGWANMTQTAELTSTRGPVGDLFGSSVSISGNTVVVGAPYGGASNQGAADVFVKPVTGWTNMTQTAELTASDGLPFDQLGSSVSIIGSTVVAGAPSPTGPGAAYVFVKPASGWRTTSGFSAKLTAADGAVGDALGSSVSISGSTVVAGAPYATVRSNGKQGAAYVF